MWPTGLAGGGGPKSNSAQGPIKPWAGPACEEAKKDLLHKFHKFHKTLHFIPAPKPHPNCEHGGSIMIWTLLTARCLLP